MELRLEGDDGTKQPPYMTQPEGPRYTSGIGRETDVEVVIERGVGWIRWRYYGGAWHLWRRMDGVSDAKPGRITDTGAHGEG